MAVEVLLLALTVSTEFVIGMLVVLNLIGLTIAAFRIMKRK